MELKDYTTEELKAELKRRVEIKKAQKAEELKTALRCRNCKHCAKNIIGYKCAIRTYGKTYKRNYCVSLSTKACDLFERKDE